MPAASAALPRRYQSTRPYDKFWAAAYPGQRQLRIPPTPARSSTSPASSTRLLRSGSSTRAATSPCREYWVRGLETRFSQGFELGESRLKWASATATSTKPATSCATGPAPTAAYPAPAAATTATPAAAEANAFYIDDRIDIGNWTITPGIRYEKIDSEQKNLLKNSKDGAAASLPALNDLPPRRAGTSTPTPRARSAPCSTARWARQCRAATSSRRRPAPGNSAAATTTASCAPNWAPS